MAIRIGKVCIEDVNTGDDLKKHGIYYMGEDLDEVITKKKSLDFEFLVIDGSQECLFIKAIQCLFDNQWPNDSDELKKIIKNEIPKNRFDEKKCTDTTFSWMSRVIEIFPGRIIIIGDKEDTKKEIIKLNKPPGWDSPKNNIQKWVTRRVSWIDMNNITVRSVGEFEKILMEMWIKNIMLSKIEVGSFKRYLEDRNLKIQDLITRAISIWDDEFEIDLKIPSIFKTKEESMIETKKDGPLLDSNFLEEYDKDMDMIQTQSPVIDEFKVVLYIRHDEKEIKCLKTNLYRAAYYKRKFYYLESLSKISLHFNIVQKSDLYNLVENALYRILIVDERVWNYQKESKIKRRLHAAGIDVNEPDVIDNIIKNRKIKYKKYDILIIHQGILDKKKNDLGGEFEYFINLLKKHVAPFIFITSGRGVPENISQNAKFINFSSIESNVITSYHQKIILTNILMKSLSVGG